MSHQKAPSIHFSDIVLDTLVAAKTMLEENREEVRKALMSPHVFAHEKRKRSLMPGSESDRALKKSFSKGEIIFINLFDDSGVFRLYGRFRLTV